MSQIVLIVLSGKGQLQLIILISVESLGFVLAIVQALGQTRWRRIGLVVMAFAYIAILAIYYTVNEIQSMSSATEERLSAALTFLYFVLIGVVLVMVFEDIGLIILFLVRKVKQNKQRVSPDVKKRVNLNIISPRIGLPIRKGRTRSADAGKDSMILNKKDITTNPLREKDLGKSIIPKKTLLSCDLEAGIGPMSSTDRLVDEKQDIENYTHKLPSSDLSSPVISLKRESVSVQSTEEISFLPLRMRSTVKIGHKDTRSMVNRSNRGIVMHNTFVRSGGNRALLQLKVNCILPPIKEDS
jgi:hypothetical protein